jgi:preprotein translocase subunit SecA
MLVSKFIEPSNWFGGPLVRFSNQINRIHRNTKRWIRDIRISESQLAPVTDHKLKMIGETIRNEVEQTGPKLPLITQFVAVVSEAVFRTQKIRMYDVQLQAIGACLGQNIVEMQTGEGKTVVTGAIAAVKTLLQPHVHVGTTNAYLAARDLESMTGTYGLLGITFGLLPDESNEDQSRRAYRQQIVYGPGYQFGFDYLRDQMELRNNRSNRIGVAITNRIRGKDPLRNLIQGESHHLAVIDEADSVLIDEALTPLIISMPSQTTEDPAPYLIAKKVVSEFEKDKDYQIELPSKKVTVNDDANDLAHQHIADMKLNLARPWRIYIVNAIRANETVQRDIDYVVVEGQVQIVDQHTGRIFPDRTWQDGFHQAVEVKENVEIQPARDSTTQITRQRYLQLYSGLAGLTGTANSASAEFRSVYRCGVVQIPTNRKCIRQIELPRFFASQESKFQAIATEVRRRHKSRQPILIGTKTIRESHLVQDALIALGLTAIVLNGVQTEDEAEIVADAGRAGAITIATNMAGRGTDIKLDADAIDAGGLHVIGTSPNASKRIDRQLVGRSARQGQPGSAQFFVSADDELIEDNRPVLKKQIIRRAKKNGESSNFSRDISKLQDQIEARHYQMRQKMILRDRWMDTVREAIEKD